MPENGFPKAEKIRKRSEIERVFANGKRYSCRGMRVHAMQNGLRVNRAVFIPVKSYANAVARNKARRVVRECWRIGKARFLSGYDVAIVLFPGFDLFSERKAQLERLLRQAGLFI